MTKSMERSPLLPRDLAPPPLASDAKTFVSAIIAFLGSGILGFPFAFKQTGVAFGVAFLVAVGALTAYCMLLIVRCKYKIQQERGIVVSTYGQIGEIVLGKPGLWLINVLLVVSQAGFAVGYLIFISANVNAYFGISKQIVAMLCIPPLILFCLLRHIKQLAYVALASDILNFTGLAVVFAADFSYINFSTGAASSPSFNWLGTISSIPFFFGVATYCFAGIGMVLPLENAMENKHNFTRILLQVVALIGTLYASFGVCGYLAFGQETKDVLTLNINGSLSAVVKLCLCAGLLCACPMMLFPVFEVLQPACLSRFRFEDKSIRTEQMAITLLRSLVVLAIAIIAGAAPSFGAFISFIGSTCCAILGFVLPVVFTLNLQGQEYSPLGRWLLRAITLIGLFAVAAGFYSAGKNMF